MRDLRYSNHKPARHIGPPRVTTLSLMRTYQSTLSRPSPPTYGVLPSNRFCNWRKRKWKDIAKQLSLVRPVSAESMGTTLVEDRVEDAQQPVLVHGRQ